MKSQTEFDVLIELDPVEIRVKAKNKTEARQKALKRLSKRNPVNLISKHYPSNRKEIHVDEI